MLILAVFLFFVTLFRVSLISPNFYLALLPAFGGIILLCIKVISGSLKLNFSFKATFLMFLVFFSTAYCFILDLSQDYFSVNASFSARIITIIIFSILPAYFISEKYINTRKISLKKLIYVSFVIQTVFFFITYASPDLKKVIYVIFGLGDSVILTDDFIRLRGFGLSGEINFMTPFLMVFLSLLMFNKNWLFKVVILLTQIINSNLAVFGFALGLISRKTKAYTKIFSVVSVFLIFQAMLSYNIFRDYFPRFYNEFLEDSDGGLTTASLLNDHVFTVRKIDPLTFLFGFQENVSSTINSNQHFSDIGWVIMFNYGGMILILLFISIIIVLSFMSFQSKKLALIWLTVGLILNTKGMIVGLNGYFFITFTFIFTRYFYETDNYYVQK